MLLSPQPSFKLMNLLKVFQSGLYPAQLNSVVLPSSSSSSSFKTEFLVAQASLDSPLPSPSTQVSASPRSQSPPLHVIGSCFSFYIKKWSRLFLCFLCQWTPFFFISCLWISCIGLCCHFPASFPHSLTLSHCWTTPLFRVSLLYPS